MPHCRAEIGCTLGAGGLRLVATRCLIWPVTMKKQNSKRTPLGRFCQVSAWAGRAPPVELEGARTAAAGVSIRRRRRLSVKASHPGGPVPQLPPAPPPPGPKPCGLVPSRHRGVHVWMGAPPRLRLSGAGGGAGRDVARGGGVSDGANGSGGGCVCGSSTGGGGVERGGSGGGWRRGRAGRGSCLGVSAFAAAPPSARTHTVASPFLRRRPAGGTIGSARTRGDAAALPAGGRPEGAARAAARRLAGGDWAVPRVWSPLSPTLPPSLPPPLPLLRIGRLRMGALDALKGAPRWMLSQPEPSPVVR